MAVKKKRKQAAPRKLKRQAAPMNIEDVRKLFLIWLDQYHYPGFPEGSDWEEALKFFPAEPGEAEVESGVCIRFLLCLHFPQNKYYISLMESLNPESRDVYFLTCHVNWDPVKFELCRRISERHHKDINESLQPRQNIWAQHFKPEVMHEALNACAAAIMGHEMGGKYQPKKIDGRIVQTFFPRRLDMAEKAKA